MKSPRMFSDLDVSTSVSTNNTDTVSQALRTTGKILSQPDRQKAAEKLREKGWSYRRIAEALQTPYILVSRWLAGDVNVAETQVRGAAFYADDEEAAKPRARTTRPAAKKASADAPELMDTGDAREIVETLNLQYKALEKYVKDLLRIMERDRLESREREERLHVELEAERVQARERDEAMRAELSNLKSRVDSLGSGGDDDDSEDEDSEDEDSDSSDDESSGDDDDWGSSETSETTEDADDDWGAPATSEEPKEEDDDWGTPATSEDTGWDDPPKPAKKAKKAAKKAEPDDDDDWGTPAASAETKDDDDDWGTPATSEESKDDDDDWGTPATSGDAAEEEPDEPAASDEPEPEKPAKKSKLKFW